MIVKKIKTMRTNKTKARQIADLVDYIRAPHCTHPEEKIAYAGGKNFLGETHSGQRAEMIALAEESVHSKMPVAHWILSWQEGEIPTPEQIDEVVDMFLEGLELSGHQVIYALHKDTHNYHLHIAVNRMNEITGKVVLPFNGFDIEAAHKAIAFIENRQGWATEKHPMFIVSPNGNILRRRDANKWEDGTALRVGQKARDFENATGEKSALRIAQERGAAIMAEASTWEELHRRLASVNLRFEKKGSGAVVFVGNETVKASSVSRAFSLKNLIKRLGTYEPPPVEASTSEEEVEPVSAVNHREWMEYQSQRKAELVRVGNAVDLRKEFTTQMRNMKARHKEEMRYLRYRLAKYGLRLLNIVSRCLKRRHEEELHILCSYHTSHIHSSTKISFEHWLRSNGMVEQAECWRYREIIEQLYAVEEREIQKKEMYLYNQNIHLKI